VGSAGRWSRYEEKWKLNAAAENKESHMLDLITGYGIYWKK